MTVTTLMGVRRNHYAEAVAIAFTLTCLSYVVGIAAGWITEVNWLEAFAVATSYASTWLCVVQRRFNYVFGAISTFAYAMLFWQFGLLASALVNLYLTPTLVYGWFRWGKDTDTRPVRHVAVKWLPVYALVTGAVYLGAVALTDALGGKLAPVDSVILVGTVLAQFLLDNKRIETWLVWIVVNVAAIYTYFNADLHLAGFQYVFFLMNAFLGYYTWNKAMND